MTEETPLAARFAQQKASIGRLAETVAGMAEATLWTSLTCKEVEAIAEVLRSDEWKETADLIVHWHAVSDEPGDMHYRLGKRHITLTLDVATMGNEEVGERVLTALREKFEDVEVLSIDSAE